MAKHEVFDARDLLSFPTGDNSTDTIFGGIHFNLTTLRHWNYTYYSNGTLSNSTKCWLTYEPYEPVLLLSNGTFINATKCYSAVDPIRARGYTGIGFATAYGLGLVLTIAALAKHGKLHLPKEKRFFPIGRRWQWYWASFVCACALISLFVNVDVDRYHIQELPIILTSFFWFLICQGTMALVWEAVRHWGSWQERQFIDPNPFVYKDDDKRAMFEFWLPLWFYAWLWLNFFLVVPRSWKFVEQQRSPEQELAKAVPAATGARFKAAAFVLLVPWLTTLVSLFHSIEHYRRREGEALRALGGSLRAIPLRFLLIIPLSLVLIAYQVLISFHWDFSVMKADGPVAAIYLWGYGPPLLIVFIQGLHGLLSTNEDKALLQQRRARGDDINRELGIVKRPAWWRRVRGEHLHTLRDKIANNVNEIGLRRAADRRGQLDAEEPATSGGQDGIAMHPLPGRGLDDPRPDSYRPSARIAGPGVRFQTAAEAGAERARRLAEITKDGPPPPYTDDDRGMSSRAQRHGAGRDHSTSSADSVRSPPQKVRSMLDI